VSKRFSNLVNRVGIVLSLVVTVVIVVSSLSPSDGMGTLPSWIPYADKGAHALAYAGFGFCVFLAIRGSTGTASNQRNGYRCLAKALLVFVLGVCLGLSLELIQPAFARSMEFLDLVADMIGVVLGILCALLFFTLSAKIGKEVDDGAV
jgi:VanZ family protein